MKETNRLAGWFGADTMVAQHYAAALDGCSWVGVPFAGGMSIVPYLTARSLLVNDLHRHIINVARCVADDCLRPVLVRRLERKAPIHPDELAEAQAFCLAHEPLGNAPDPACAEAYFVSCWMGRASKAGTESEFEGGPATRWNSGGGDSAVRYFSALRALVPFSQSLRRCTFSTNDAFDMLARGEDTPEHGWYADPPFPEVGRKYRHNAGKTAAEERAWHTRLRDALRFKQARVVARFYDHVLIRELYPEPEWTWKLLAGGRKQSNDAAPEVLVGRNLPVGQERLF